MIGRRRFLVISFQYLITLTILWKESFIVSGKDLIQVHGGGGEDALLTVTGKQNFVLE